jgi:transcriptional regulator GlxA family with amidase domain
MPKAVFVLTEQMLSTSVTWPMDMLAAANQTARHIDRDLPTFELNTVSTNSDPVQCHTGLSLHSEYTIEQVHTADIVYLPALWRNPRLVIKKQPLLLNWLQEQFENGAIISGVGTGCCFMAEAGLLNNKPATTHWYYFDQFQKQYPQVQLKRQHFITQSGNIYCAASINSLADLTIYFIQRFLNQKIAQHVQRHFSHEVRRAYEAVSYFEDDNTNHPDEDILQAQLWLQNNLTKDVSMQSIAEQFGMSPRNFTRRFKTAIGKTPTHYLQELRIKTAQDLLQSSNLSIGEIADKVGYSDIGYFSKLFRRSLSITPRDYRTTVRAKLFSSKNIKPD